MAALENERHQRRPSPACSTLPQDIIFQIIILLPLKSVTRCKCVCKSWYALLTDPKFLSLYNHERRIVVFSQFPASWLQSMDFERLPDPVIEEQEFPTENMYVLANDGLCKAKLSKCSYFKTFRFKILGSCHGLMLSSGQEGKHLFLWNTTTRQCMRLPRVGYSHKDIYGIGFDSSSKDYKVVRVVNGNAYNWNSDEIGVFVNGFLHWLADDNDDEYLIVSLDLVEQKFHVVPLPDNICKDNIFHVGAFEGLLCAVFDGYKDDGDRVWSIWVTKQYGVKESWTILMAIPYMVKTDGVKPLCVTKNGEIIMQVNGKEIVKYDQKREKFKTLLKFKIGIEAAVIRESLDAPMSPIAIAASKRCKIEKESKNMHS